MSVPQLPDNLPQLGLQTYLVWKAFGPAAGAVGDQLAQLVDFAGENVRRVVRVSVDKLGTKIEDEGSVSGRSLLKTLDEATTSDDEVIAEYLGGVLASARTPDGTDDKAVSWSALIGRLSSEQLRLHFALYTSLRGLVVGSDANLGMDTERHKLATYVGLGSLFVCCGWWKPEDGPVTNEPFEAFGEAFDGLHREGLVGDEYKFGSSEHIKDKAPGATDFGLVWEPSLPGLRLFLWGHGLGGASPNAFLEDREFPVSSENVTVPENVALLSQLREREAEKRRAERDGGQAEGS